MSARDPYLNGIRDGKTEATLEGLAKSMDDLKEKLEGLPCSERAALFASVRADLKKVWAIVLLMLAGLLGIVWRVLGV